MTYFSCIMYCSSTIINLAKIAINFSIAGSPYREEMRSDVVGLNLARMLDAHGLGIV